MTRPVLAAALLAAPAFAPLAAQAPAHYVATPAAAAVKPLLMTHQTPWHLVNGAYQAGPAPERDLVVCQLVAREAGKLASFAVAGKPLDADALAKCNARAK